MTQKRLNQKPVIVTTQVTQQIEVTPRWLAEVFCDMDDEQQAQFFIECAEIAKGWKPPQSSLGAGWQWYTVGRHLATCSCSNEDARDMVRDIAGGIDPRTNAA